MFFEARSFSQDLSIWCATNVGNLEGTWFAPLAFDADADAWDLPDSNPPFNTTENRLK